jgi:hypothetical protein
VQIVSDAFDREVGVDRVRGGQHAAASGPGHSAGTKNREPNTARSTQGP